MSTTEKELSAVVRLFYETSSLRFLSRAHQTKLLTRDPSDNIAAHSFLVAFIAWNLARLEGADPYRTVLMGLVHDLPEARTGDQNWVAKNYVHEEEERAAREQLWVVPFGRELLEPLLEFQEGESLEARVAKDADHLAQLVLLKEYAHQGNREAETWLRRNELLQFHTESARTLAREIVSQAPSDWWQDIWRAEKK